MVMKFLEGERVYLRPLLAKDAQGRYTEWLNDPEVCAGNSHHLFPYSEEKALSYIQHANSTDSALILAIVLKDKDVHIGNISLQRINWVYGSAEFAVLLGDKTRWNQGYGLEAARLLVAHGFSALNLRRIECATFETNEGMKKLALGLGMKQEGTRRQAAFKNGRHLDIVEFGILREEFKL